jgi:sugar-specific transcriptional regulator TrmB
MTTNARLATKCFNECAREEAKRRKKLLNEAAPELLEAAKAAEEELCKATFPGRRDQRGLNYAIKKLRAAIAKAQGE